MFVLDGAKARAAALILIIATAIQLVPHGHATEQVNSIAKTRSSDEDAPAVEKPEPNRDPIEIVLATARKQLGKPYRWGATGPSSFDCSGFTSYVWKGAGVKMPRTSSQQRAWTKAIPKKVARAGDLVFAPGHVGLYLGKGKMIHSPRTGRRVEISPIHEGTYGFGRVPGSD